ncbi:phosphotransferase [Microlunatus soli]|uniref:phosphotransferase n=1 Tax=Microlunatus soli TaxID=630515 RepID=UPI000B836E78|nr:phosphotransferase [Microlunatus soli]
MHWWDGRGAIRLLDHDHDDYALLIARCRPGIPISEHEELTAEWAGLAERRMQTVKPPYDAGLVSYGIDLLRTLPGSAEREVIVHGDYNPGNVLAARTTIVAELVDVPGERILAWSLTRCVEAALWFADRSEIDNGAARMAEAAVVAHLL